TDAFGPRTRRGIVSADRMLVPSGKALGGAAPAPPGGLDHYRCYRAFESGFAAQNVTVTDQFETARVYGPSRRSHFCAPVNKSGAGILQPGAFLTCYKARVPTGAPPVTKVRGQIHVNN